MPEFSILGASCLLTIAIQVEKPIVSQLIDGMFPETFHQSFQFFFTVVDLVPTDNKTVTNHI